MAGYRVLCAAFVQPLPAADGRPPSTRTRAYGEVFDMDAKAAELANASELVDKGYLERVAGDLADLAPVAVPTTMRPDSPLAPVRLATGQGPALLAADFRPDLRTVEQASTGVVVGVETDVVATAVPVPGTVVVAEEKPAGNASKEAWVEFAVAHGFTEDEADGMTRDELRDYFE